MRLEAITARAHADGNRIELSWELPADASLAGVRVVRRTGRYPGHPGDGVTFDVPVPQHEFSDSGLRGEQMHYYSLFPYQGNPPLYLVNTENQVMALATSPQGYGDYMFSLLPALFHRYDKDDHFLQRLLGLVGGQLDQLHSLSEYSRRLRDLGETPGSLLPLMAQWIAWNTDFKRDLNSQRDEIRNAPAIYRRVGLLPTVQATVKRISNLESQTKEYVHNIAVSNRPERLNLWSMQREGDGTWSAQESLVSLDHAFDGKACTAIDQNGLRWFFYHTLRKGRWEIWCKTSPSLQLDMDLVSDLQVGTISTRWYEALIAADLTVLQSATVTQLSGNVWDIDDGVAHYLVEVLADRVMLYVLSTLQFSLGASSPVVSGQKRHLYKYPAVAAYASSLWLFWSDCDESDPTAPQWSIRLQIREDARWSQIGPESGTSDTSINPFISAGIYDESVPRRYPQAAIDGNGRLWLFWLEQQASHWRLRYNRHDGANWGEPIDFPLDSGDEPRVVSDLHVLIDPAPASPRIIVFWSRPMVIGAPISERWQVAYRIKNDINFDSANWGSINSLPKHAVDDDHHDREACPILTSAGLELFWSSNREDSGWAIWSALITDPVANTWDQLARITSEDYSQRAALAIADSGRIGLIYRSNRARSYISEAYRATQTHDRRYTGTTTVDVRHLQRIQQYSQHADYQTYTYDTGNEGRRDDDDRIARDTIGVFLQSQTYSEAAVQAEIERLRAVVHEFMPITDRAVFQPYEDHHTEIVYAYSQPGGASARYISETYTDDFSGGFTESVLEGGLDFTDTLGDST